VVAATLLPVSLEVVRLMQA
jgi:hypothetical protein